MSGSAQRRSPMGLVGARLRPTGRDGRDARQRQGIGLAGDLHGRGMARELDGITTNAVRRIFLQPQVLPRSQTPAGSQRLLHSYRLEFENLIITIRSVVIP